MFSQTTRFSKPPFKQFEPNSTLRRLISFGKPFRVVKPASVSLNVSNDSNSSLKPVIEVATQLSSKSSLI